MKNRATLFGSLFLSRLPYPIHRRPQAIDYLIDFLLADDQRRGEGQGGVIQEFDCSIACMLPCDV